MSQNAAGIQFVISGDTRPLMQSFNAAKAQLKDTTWMSNLSATIGSAAKTYAMATGAAAAAMVVPFYVAMNATQEYNDNIIRSIALGGDEFEGRWDDMTDAVNKYSTQLGVSANDTSKAIITLTKAGWSYGEIFTGNMLETVTKISTANQTSVDVAAETMNAAMHIWDGNVTTMADQLQMAVNASTLDVEDLAYAFRYSGAAAKAAGVDFDSYISMLGALSQIEAEGGESLSTTFLRLFTDDKQALNDIFNAQIVDQEGKLNLDLLMASSGQMTMEQQQDVFDEYSIRVGKNINYFKLIAQEYKEILGDVADSTGVLDKAASDMSVSIPKLKQRILGAIYAPLLSEDVQTAITGALTAIFEVTSSDELATKIKEIFELSANFVKFISPKLLESVGRIMDMFIENEGTIVNLATAFFKLIEAISKIPGSLLIAGGAMMAFMKIFGMMRDTMVSFAGSGGMVPLLSNTARMYTSSLSTLSGSDGQWAATKNAWNNTSVRGVASDAWAAIRGRPNVDMYYGVNAAVLNQSLQDRANQTQYLQNMKDARYPYIQNNGELSWAQAMAASAPGTRLVDQMQVAREMELKYAPVSRIGIVNAAYRNMYGTDYSKIAEGSIDTYTSYNPKVEGGVGVDYSKKQADVALFGQYSAQRSADIKAAADRLREVAAAQKEVAAASAESTNALGMTAAQTEVLNQKAMNMAATFQQALGGIMGIAGGFTMIIASSNPLIQWLGLVTVAVSTLVTMFTLLKAVMQAGSIWTIPLALGVTAAVTAAAGYVLMDTQKNQAAAERMAKSQAAEESLWVNRSEFDGGGITDPEPTDSGEETTQTNIPGLASGGIVRKRPGGTLAILGEGRHDELVLPLNANTRAVASAAGVAGVSNTTIDNRVINNYYPEPPSAWYRVAARYGV